MRKFFLFICMVAFAAGNIFAAYMPKSAVAGISVNFTQLFKSPVYSELKKNPKFVKFYKQFEEKVGLPVDKALNRAMISIEPPTKGSGRVPNILICANLLIDSEKLTKIISEGVTKKGGKLEEISEKGLKILKITPQNKQVGYVIFVDKDRVALVNEAWKDEVVDAITNKKTSPNPLFKKMNDMKDKTVVITLNIPEDAKKNLSRNPMAAILTKANSILLSIDLSKYFALELNLICANKEDATSLSNGLNGFLMMGRAILSQKGLDEVLNYLSISSEGNTTKISFSLTKEQAEALRKKVEELKKGAPMPGKPMMPFPAMPKPVTPEPEESEE